MASDGTVTVRITGDTKGLQGALGDSDSHLSKFGSKMGGIAKGVGVAFAAIGTAAVGGAVVVGKQLFEMGASLEAMDAKAKTVFGDQIGLVGDWAKKNAAAMGLTKTEATGLAAGFADLLVPMGFTRKQAAAMSTDVIGLSGALSEWSGGTKDAAEVSDILAKAMLGETDGLKSLGISISAADVELRLATKGQKGLTGAALEQAKALAVQELIFAKSTDAQAAYAKGTAKGIRTQAEFGAKIGEIKEALARGFYPVATKIIGLVTSSMVPVFEKVSGAVAKIVDYFKLWRAGSIDLAGAIAGLISDDLRFLDVIQRVIDAMKIVASFIKDNAVPAIGALGAVVAAVVVPAVWTWAAATAAAAAASIVAWAPAIALAAALAGLAAGVVYAYQHFEGFRDVVDNVAAFLKDVVLPAVGKFVGYIIEQFGNLVGWVKQFWPQISEAITHVVNVVAGVIRTTIDVISALWRAWGDDLLNYVKTIWNFIRETIENALQVIKGIIQTVVALINGDWGKAWNGIRNIVGAVWDQIGNIISTAIGAIKSLLGGLASTVGQMALGLWDPIKDGFKSVINWIIDRWNGLEFKMPSVGPIGGFTVGVPDIPRLHTGGVVPGAPGSDVLAMLQAGERVIPRGAAGGGGGGTVVNNYINLATLDPAAAGPLVVTAIREYERRNGTNWRTG